MKTQNFVKNIFIILIVALGILFLYKCPYAYLFGISCPGCGMTRSFIALAHLDFRGAFHYHPLFWLVILLGLGWLGEKLHLFQLSNRQKNVILWSSCVAFLCVYFIRLLSGSDVVFIDFESSLIYRLWNVFREFSTLSA